MSRKIVFINQATGYLTIDIINEFASAYEKVALVTGSIRVQDVKINEKVNVVKITKYNRGGILKKSFSWLVGTLQIYWLLLFRFRSYEIFLTTLPPTAYLLTMILRKRKFSILFYDIYPEALKILNISDRNIIFRLWSSFNKRILNKTHRIYTLSEGMKIQLRQYSQVNNIVVIPNWSGLTFNTEDLPASNPFRIENKLEPYFLIEYSGNIGYSHRVEIVVELAKLLTDEKDIYFIIIGRGERLEYINNLIRTYNLRNCHTLPFQPDDKIKYSLSAADLSIITLDGRAPTMSVPSKVYNLLKVGSPIMGIGSADSELSRLLEEKQNGRNFLPSEMNKMAEFILQLKNNPEILQKFRNKSLLASKEYTNANSKKYLQSYQNIN